MKQNDRIKSALLAVFPTIETFNRFCEKGEHQETVASLARLALEHGIIETADEKSLGAFIHYHARGAQDTTPPNHLTFEDLFDKKENLLELHLSARALTERINALVREHGIALPKVSNSMLTRLKKEAADTAHKQNTLRSLAFWLGYERGSLGPVWNFETLLKLCRESKPSVNYKEGVRVGFAIYSRGDVIDHEIIRWLKKELNGYISQSVDRLPYGRWGKVRSHDITTLYVDFPNEEQTNMPAAYRQCLRSSVSLAHQISIRWALSRYCTRNRFLSIGIAAGDFSALDNYLLPILNAKLPGDPVIRMTDYTRQCLLINDIRAQLCSRPTETTLFNGETLSIWWVVGLWSTLYFDFVPDLLSDPILQNTPEAVEKLNRLLLSSVGSSPQPSFTSETNAITTYYRFPHNSLLGLEIAKTLYYRHRFWEALDILRIVLTLNPTHLNARTLRMVLFRNLAIEAESYVEMGDLFKQADLEAQYIMSNCTFQMEDFFCEYAVNSLAEAMLTLRYQRESKRAEHETRAAPPCLNQSVFDSLARAEESLTRGMLVSPSGIRATYLLNTVKVLNAILKNDRELFTNPDKPIDAGRAVVRQPSRSLEAELGYYRHDYPAQGHYEFIEKLYQSSTRTHDESISLQAYRLTTLYCTAVAWWDLYPVRTVAVAKRALRLLNDALNFAKIVSRDGVFVYSFTRTYGEMLPAEEFIGHLKRSIRMIRRSAGEDLSRRDDRECIEPQAGLSSILLTLNF